MATVRNFRTRVPYKFRVGRRGGFKRGRVPIRTRPSRFVLFVLFGTDFRFRRRIRGTCQEIPERVGTFPKEMGNTPVWELLRVYLLSDKLP